MNLRLFTHKNFLSHAFAPASPVASQSPHTSLESLVTYYQQWLSLENQRNHLLNTPAALECYYQEAMQSVQVRNQELRLFAPFHEHYSALTTFTATQVLFLVLSLLLFLLGMLWLGVNMLVISIGALTVLYFSDLLLTFFLSARTLSLSAEEQIPDELVYALAEAAWPPYTILCPLYQEAEIVPQFVQAMQALDYPQDRLQILFLTEEDDNATRNAITELHLPTYFSIVVVPDGKPRTKPRACNYGLLQANGDYVVIYDAEDAPEPLQLKKAILAFANRGEDTACIQAKLNFYNPDQNILTRWFTAEYSLWFDLTLPGLQKLGVPLPLGGTSNHFRTHLLRQMGAWDAYNVTEDCDLGLRMSSYGFKTAVLDSTTYEEANSQFRNWIRQRSRWIKGYMQTYLVYMRYPQQYLKPGRWIEFLSLQLFVGAKTGVLFINPFMWLLLLIYIFFPQSVTGLYHILFPMPVLYMGVLCLIFGNFFYTYSHFLGCMKRKHYHLLKWTLLIPLYWAMASIAAFLALYQLIFKPHYWEKTLHGLYLRSAHSLPTIATIAEAFPQTSLANISTLNLTHLSSAQTHPLDPLRSTAASGSSIHTSFALPDLTETTNELANPSLFSLLPEHSYKELISLERLSSTSNHLPKALYGSPTRPLEEENHVVY